jgi:hypothetical protein
LVELLCLMTVENSFDSSHDHIKATHKPGTNDADNNLPYNDRYYLLIPAVVPNGFNTREHHESI